jgi:peptide/nickel transport system permease protein
MLGLVTVSFFLVRIVPADPVRAAIGPLASQSTYEHVQHQFGYDLPLWKQYVTYLSQLIQGDLGTSLTTKRSVTADILSRWPASAELAIAAAAIAISGGIILGVVSARRRGSVVDACAQLGSVAGVSIPTFWLGLLLQLLFGSILVLLPISGRIDGDLLPPHHYTGFYIIDSILSGDWAALKSCLLHLILPAVTLAIPMLAVVARMTRAGMLEVLNQDFTQNARAAGGLPEFIVANKYALKNSLVGAVSQIGLSIGAMLGGAVLVETVFDWPGLGQYMVQAANNQDLQPIVGTTIVVGLSFVLVNIVTDIVYRWLDPRIEL